MAPKVATAKPAAKIGKKPKIDGKKKLKTHKKTVPVDSLGARPTLGSTRMLMEQDIVIPVTNMWIETHGIRIGSI